MKQFSDAVAESGTTTDAVVFLPSVKDIYPLGIVLNVPDQRGTFVEVKGFSHQMEGQTRPTFFRGVATVNIRMIRLHNRAHVYPTGGDKTL